MAWVLQILVVILTAFPGERVSGYLSVQRERREEGGGVEEGCCGKQVRSQSIFAPKYLWKQSLNNWRPFFIIIFPREMTP